jgi:lysophospholipase L1-like esterase
MTPRRRVILAAGLLSLAALAVALYRRLVPTAPAQSTVIAPDHPDLRYTGRWDRTNPTLPSVGWQGAQIAFVLEGTAISARLRTLSSIDYLLVILDEVVQPERIRISADDAPIVIAAGLANGKHRIQIIKETAQGGDMQFAGLTVTGTIVADETPAPRRHIVFFGDSNLAGESLRHEENNGDITYMGCHHTYAGIAARMCNASYENISYGGATIGSIHSIYRQMSRQNPAAWDALRTTADVVVIDLGSNDVDNGEKAIRAAYHAFLDDIRTTYPQAHIVLYNSFGWSFNEPANYSAAVVAERTDAQMSAARFPWFFEQWHGCEYDHAGMATLLAQHLEKTLGWDMQSADVMNGYGQNGNVANGSFAESAPFSGFGWRYGLKPGVTRITAEAGFDGNHFVRLAAGARIHQPNPASNGSTISVTMAARSADGGSLVTIIDYRNQEMYSEPLSAESQTHALTTDWQTYTMTLLSPVLTATPVFHTRLTFVASGGTVDIDAVQMTTL